jgi:hypothetical protein
MAPPSIKAAESDDTCGLYTPGHDVHWIQARHAGSDTVNRARAGKLLEAHPDGTLVVDVAHHLYRLWHHNPSRLQRLVAENKGKVGFQPYWPAVDALTGWPLCVLYRRCGRSGAPTVPRAPAYRRHS